MPFDNTSYVEAPVETKPDVFSLEGLAAWLRTQPRETTYCYTMSADCLLTRYFAAHGVENTLHFSYGGRFLGPYHPLFRVAQHIDGSGWGKRNYATALARCEDLIARRAS